MLHLAAAAAAAHGSETEHGTTARTRRCPCVGGMRKGDGFSRACVVCVGVCVGCGYCVGILGRGVGVVGRVRG